MRLERGVAGHPDRRRLTGLGQVMLLAGEPGIGKTRLAEEIAEAAAAGSIPCLWGRATDEEGRPPYWPFRQILRGLDEAVLAPVAAKGPAAREVAAGVPPGGPADAQERFRLFEAVTAALIAAAPPEGPRTVSPSGALDKIARQAEPRHRWNYPAGHGDLRR